ncbi:TlpA disulfide reductase family protein [Paenibacillus algorifonticola]|uniref:TlpA family protein disulfide reductase n=1 Tax=Paenibacillus algorifonticola TaxID=684063 RepID=UPI003D280692
MKKASAWFIVAFVLAGLAISQYMEKDSAIIAASGDFKPKAGYSAQQFELQALDEQMYKIGGEQGKLSFVNFWASWCGPCELEAPDLQELHEKYGDKIAMYGVNSTKFDKERAARQFVLDHEFTFTILMDREGDVTKEYKVNTFPTTFLIDSKGVIRERINGVIPLSEWDRLIEKYS